MGLMKHNERHGGAYDRGVLMRGMGDHASRTTM